MLNKSLHILFTLLFIGVISKINAQEKVPYDQGTTYILADVKVTGKITYNPQTVVIFTGLERGQKITIPGDQISSAIKKLGKLGLFSDIDFYVNKIVGDSIYLELDIKELPKLNEVKVVGVKKAKEEEIIKENDLKKGKIVTENLITTTKNYTENKFKKNGFFNTKTNINIIPDTTKANEVKMLINIDRGMKVKIGSIDIEGNNKFSDSQVRSAMKNTKEKYIFNIFKSSKFIKDKYREDLENIIKNYKEKGYRDARIIYDSVAFNKETNLIAIKIKLEEGTQYRFGEIKFLGNSVYSDHYLNNLLGIRKGDVYNGVLLEKRINDKTKPDGVDITNLYQNNGYLFSNVNAVETKTENGNIDFEIRIYEGQVAFFNKITVVGNDKTNDHVIYRELQTKPGQKYSREDLMRTMRDLSALGYFDPQAMRPDFKNVDPAAGTVDIEYHLVEKGSSQIELQGGYGGGGFVGTLGLSFNNFSMRNIFNKESYNPLPMGDGQKVSLRLQGSTYFQTYSMSFSEPWFGGKKPVSFNSSVSYTKQYLNNFSQNFKVDKTKSFNMISLSVGSAKRLSVPDNSFVLSQSASFQFYDLNNYYTGLFSFGDGKSRNLAYTIALSRNNKGLDPIFPTYGSEFAVSAKLTLPYSMVNGVNYATLGDQEEYKLKYESGKNLNVLPPTDGTVLQEGDYLAETAEGSGIYKKVDSYTEASADRAKVDQKKYNWLEYYKIKFRGDWYTKVYGKLVFRTLGEFAFLGNYNKDRGNIPFERFYVGGDGMQTFSMDGRETVQLRGYPNQSLTPIDKKGSQNGALIYNKFLLELRYPITLNQAAKIYALSFLEAGSGFDETKRYNPFQLQRSAGAGIRVFMPQFGLLGFDFGYGFDPSEGKTQPNGWQTHFIIGQQF
ncbi:MAG: outer membrane protein assembly factor [Flavobacterium sp.]